MAGQWILGEQQCKKKSQITDIISWIQAYSRYMAVLMSCETTTKEEATGLVAHLHLIIQLSLDLGSQWQKYDRDFREWAAAKSLRRWGKLNFPIYGRCLAVQQRQPTSSWSETSSRGQKFTGDKRKSTPYNAGSVCLKWNFKGFCDRQQCQFAHKCYHCGRQHQGKDCKFISKN